MNHIVLARKYRPKNFSEVVGQELIVKTLKAALDQDRVAHVMLFTGGRGIGKTTIARIVAKALVCLARVEGEPCNVCAQCVAIDNFSSLDVLEIDGASHTGVDDVRSLRDSARFQPSSARYKIFIIDEVHMLSTSAFNALLKILEEPPLHVMFIFATTEAHKIPKTVLSRCQRYDFKRMSVATIHQTLKHLMTEEGLNVAEDGLHLLAELADGGLRDALSMLEQVVSQKQAHYSADFIAELLGVVSHRAVKDVCHALIEGDVATALSCVKDVYDKGLDLCQLMDAITERFRLWSLCAHVDKKKALVIMPSLLEEDFELAHNHDKADLKRLFAMSLDALPQVFSAHRPLLAIELFLLRAALRPPVSDVVSINYCLNKLDAIMHNRPVPPEPSFFMAATKPTAPVQKIPANTQPKKPLSVPEQFRKLVTDLAPLLPALASHLRHARPVVEMDKGILRLCFEQSLHYEQALTHQNHSTLKNAILSVFGQELAIIFELKKSVDKEIKTLAETEIIEQKQDEEALIERAKNNPIVQKALEIFGGDITQVKRVAQPSSRFS